MTSSFDTNASRRDVLRIAAAGAAAFSMGSYAQSTWPAKPVTMIVPFPAGGGTDAFARPMSAQFARLTGKQLVSTTAAARGTLGASIAAKASPEAKRCSGCCAPHHRTQHVTAARLRHRKRTIR